MKIQIVLILVAFFVCSCQISQKAQSNENPNAGVSNQNTANENENQQTKVGNSNEVDESRFSSVKINRTDKKKYFSLKINVEYPQLKNAKTLQEKKFNQYVKKQVDEQILDFTNHLSGRNTKTNSGMEYEINLSYEINYVSKDFVSALMSWNGFSGYLNMDYFPSTINYDLRKGKMIALKDIFEPNTNYLNKVAEESRKILKRTCLMCGCGNGIKPGDPLPENLIKEAETKNQNANTDANSKINYQDGLFFGEGTKPKEENYSGWSITSEGLKITFGEYQVGPGCIGIIHIAIPFADLQPILRKDLNFN